MLVKGYMLLSIISSLVYGTTLRSSSALSVVSKRHNVEAQPKIYSVYGVFVDILRCECWIIVLFGIQIYQLRERRKIYGGV